MALEAVVAAARGGDGRVVAIEGAAGIGKTRLLAEGRRVAAAAGFEVLTARGGELEEEFAYGIVRQLFEPVLADAPEQLRAELLAGAAGLAAPLFDERQLAAALTGAADTSFATLHGLYWLAANLAARQPTLLAIDDLHWADAPSLRWLLYLARRLDGVPLLLLVCLRPLEQSRQGSLLRELVADSEAVLVRPGALGRASITTLAREVFSAEPDVHFCAACQSATGGNPLLLRALLATLAADGIAPTAAAAEHVEEVGPEPVARAVAVRLSRLAPEATALARATAVLGDGAELVHASRLAGLELDEARSIATLLARAGLVQLDPWLAFTHPIMRAAVYGEIDAVERAMAHRQAAAVLAEAGREPEQPAAHLLRVPPAGDPLVPPILQSAARRALARGAADAAVAYLRRALSEPAPPDQRPELLRELGIAELATEPLEAIGHLQEACATTSGPERRAETALHLNRAFLLANRPAEAVATLQAALEQLGPERSHLHDLLDIALINWAGWVPGFERLGVQRLAALREEERRTGAASPHVCATLAFYEARIGSSSRRSTELAEQVVANPTIFQALDVNITSVIHAGMTLTFADEVTSAERVYEQLLTEAGRQGHRYAVATALLFRGFLNLQRGRLLAAEEDLSSLPIPVSDLAPVARGFWAAWMVEVLLERGELEQAREIFTSVPLDEQRAGHVLFYLCSRGRLHLEAGEPGKALPDFELVGEIGASLEPLPALNPAVVPWRSRAALALHFLGRQDEACTLAREELERAQRWGAARTVGVSLRALGLVEGTQRGQDSLRVAVEVLAGSPAPLEHAKALVDLGAALRRDNQRSEARQLLRQAVELAHRCGALRLVEQANDELAATGAHRRSVVLSGLDALTASERRVAQLAADDLSNKEIAQALFVTVKTVEVHLSRVYRKLDIGSRRQLAAALAEPAAATA